MSGTQFMELIADTPLTYAVAMIMTLAVYLLLYRKQIYAIFDPFCFLIVSTAFAATDVVFLWWRDLIDARYFIQFINTEAAFLVGLILFKPLNRRIIIRNAGEGEKRFLGILYIVSAATFILSQAITYVILGIPILYESRNSYYSAGGGIGVLNHILNVTWTFSFYLLVYCFASKINVGGWFRLFNVLVGVALVASAILSGSKATFVPMVFLIFYFRFLHRGDQTCSVADKSLAKLQKITAISAIGAIFLVIGVQLSSESPAAWLVSLYWRIADFGDVYFMAYPTHIIDAIPGKGGFLAVFGSLLGPFRIVPYDSLPETLGFVLHRMVYGFNNFSGPNDRHNVFGVVYFGTYGSILYSLILGMIVGFIRNRLPAFVHPGSAVEPLYVYLALSCCLQITGGIELFMNDIGSMIIVMPVLYAMAALVYLASTRGHATAEYVRTITYESP
jgi:hypothetical protein